jgi:hypothetical protein
MTPRGLYSNAILADFDEENHWRVRRRPKSGNNVSCQPRRQAGQYLENGVSSGSAAALAPDLRPGDADWSAIMTDPEKQKPAPGASKLGLGIALGAGIGAALGVAMDNIAIGVAIGVGVGTAIGAALAAQDAKPRDKGD